MAENMTNGTDERPNWVGTRKSDPRGTAHSILDIQNMPEAGHASEMQHDREVRAKEAEDRADDSLRGVRTWLVVAHVVLWVAIACCVLVVFAIPRFSTVMLRTFHDPYLRVGVYPQLEPVLLAVVAALFSWVLVELELVLHTLPERLVSLRNASAFTRMGWATIGIAVLFLIRSLSFPQLEATVLCVACVLVGSLFLLVSSMLRAKAEKEMAKALRSTGTAAEQR